MLPLALEYLGNPTRVAAGPTVGVDVTGGTLPGVYGQVRGEPTSTQALTPISGGFMSLARRPRGVCQVCQGWLPVFPPLAT